MLVTIDRYTRYYVNQSGGGEIDTVYRASFRMQRGNGIGPFFRGLFRFVKPLLISGAKEVGKDALIFLIRNQNSLWVLFSKIVSVKPSATSEKRLKI